MRVKVCAEQQNKYSENICYSLIAYHKLGLRAQSFKANVSKCILVRAREEMEVCVIQMRDKL